MKAKNDNENIKNSFLFYRSFYEAIGTLSKKNRLIAYEAIMKYALYREEITDLPPRVLCILKMAMPNIDASHKRYLKRLESKSQVNPNETYAIFEEEVMLPKKEKTLPKCDDTDLEIDNSDGEEFGN